MPVARPGTATFRRSGLDVHVAVRHSKEMSLIQYYEQVIAWIVTHGPATPDKFVHTYAGMGIWLTAAILLRKPLASIWPLLPVIVLELANETADRLANGSWQWQETTHDIAATWFWPLALFCALRLFPWLVERRPTLRLAPSFQHHVDRPVATVTPMRAADGDDVRRVLAGR